VAPSDAATAAPQRPVLVVADDDEAITSNLAPFLTRAGFTVHVAGDGQAALELADRVDPDLCVLDVLMPRVDGREVLRRLRGTGRWVPVLLLTHVGDAAERAMALDEGADDYLNKPFDPQELVARVRAVLRRIQPGRPPLSAARVLRAGPLRLDRVARRAWLAGREVALTPKAMLLLDYITTHPDELLSRDRLLEVLWGFDYPVGTRAVDNRIAELRRVLGAYPEVADAIETVPGQGYRFAPRIAPTADDAARHRDARPAAAGAARRRGP
jgi:DNA-binding response OmpR family regulator